MKKYIAIVGLILAVSVSAQTNNNYKKFIESLKKELSQIANYEEHFDERYLIFTEENDYFYTGVRIDLTNLYNNCSQEDENEWSMIIRQHLEQGKKIRLEEKEVTPMLEKLETAIKYLKFRIYSIDYLTQADRNSIIDSRFTDFIGVVVVDFPSGVKNLEKSYLSKWSISDSEIIKLAIDNTLKSNHEKFEESTSGNAFKINTLFSDENIFITSSVYDLVSKNIPLGTLGSLVAIPNRMGIVTKPVEKKTFFSDLLQLIGLANYMYEQGPVSITNVVYWFNGKTLQKIEHNKKRKSIKLPLELEELLK